VIAVGLVAMWFGFASGVTTTGSTGLPSGVEAVSPVKGAQVQRQTEITADLAPGYDGTLIINGVEVPPDQLTFDLGQNLLIFPCRLTADSPTGRLTTASSLPGVDQARPPQPPCSRASPGAELLAVPKGNVTATVIYWKILAGRANSQHSFTWTFVTY
jgi:hypothetical protein